jgi:hypothetical protein
VRPRDAIEHDWETMTDEREQARLLVEILLDIRESLVDLVLLASEPDE